jgi:uncharacterized membrane protein
MTMSAIPTRPDQVELYLSHLNAALLDVPRAEREDFMREIRVHIFDKLQQECADIPAVLEALGHPEDLARHFHSELKLSASSRSWSPWVLMKTAARWALTGFQGFAVFMVAFLGYTMAACFYVTAALKPIFPNNIGFWVSDQGPSLATWPMPAGAHEYMAPYYTLIAFVLGFLFVAGTSFVVRIMMKKFARARKWLT